MGFGGNFPWGQVIPYCLRQGFLHLPFEQLGLATARWIPGLIHSGDPYHPVCHVARWTFSEGKRAGQCMRTVL